MRLRFLKHPPPLEARSRITVPGTNVMCSDDAAVQKAVAKLNTAISTTSGILGVLTTGWWTQVSGDSTPLNWVAKLSLNASYPTEWAESAFLHFLLSLARWCKCILRQRGIVLTVIRRDIVFVAVVMNSDRFPGGYHLLVLSNMIDGLLGGSYQLPFFVLACGLRHLSLPHRILHCSSNVARLC